MDQTIFTPRLKLTLVTTARRGSSEFDCIHGLRSNEQSSWWSLYGASKSPEDTENGLKNILPIIDEDEQKKYRVAYAVHEIVRAAAREELAPRATQEEPSTQFIGLVTLRTLSSSETTSPPHLGHASTPTTLSLELAYMFLPTSWGHGYATESVNTVFDACKRAGVHGVWAPFSKVYVRSIVHDENRPSQRVMEKCGMEKPEIIEFQGGRFFIAGKWRENHRLFIYGKMVVE